MVEAKKYDRLLVGNTARDLNSKKPTSSDTETNVVIHFDRIVIDSIWKAKQEYEKVSSVYNVSDYVKDEESLLKEFVNNELKITTFTNCIIDENYKKGDEYDLERCASSADIPTSIAWQLVQKILNDKEASQCIGRNATTQRRKWNAEVGAELQMSIEDRFGISLDDAVLQRMQEYDFEVLHVQIETSIRSLMVQNFFGSCAKFFCLITPEIYQTGINDQVIPACSLKIAFELFCPCEPIMDVIIPGISKWVLGDDANDHNKVPIKETDVSLREKIKRDGKAYYHTVSACLIKICFLYSNLYISHGLYSMIHYTVIFFIFSIANILFYLTFFHDIIFSFFFILFPSYFS